MPPDMMGLQDTLPGFQQLVEGAERHRDEHSVDVLKKYLGLHLGDLLPLASTMTQGIFEQIITYLGGADEDTKCLTRQKYTALWEVFIRENTSGIVGLLLAKEIVLSALLPHAPPDPPCSPPRYRSAGSGCAPLLPRRE